MILEQVAIAERTQTHIQGIWCAAWSVYVCFKRNIFILTLFAFFSSS